jgi:hypothetical protein
MGNHSEVPCVDPKSSTEKFNVVGHAPKEKTPSRAVFCVFKSIERSGSDPHNSIPLRRPPIEQEAKTDETDQHHGPGGAIGP